MCVCTVCVIITCAYDFMISSLCYLKQIEVLGDFGQNDWQLSSLVCKTLWNFSDKLKSSVLCFGMEEADLIAEQLEVYLGEGQHCMTTMHCVH